MVKVSVAMTTFNDENTIIPVLDQLVSQSYRPDEIVIVDGGSKDDTVAVIKQYAKNKTVKIKVISDGIRRNIPAGFNCAIQNCDNSWVLVIGTGNSYENDFIRAMIEAQENTDSKLLYCTIVGSNKTKFGYYFNQYFLRGNDIQDLDISNHGMLIHKDIFNKIGYFWEDFVYAGEDLEFSRRVHNNNVKSYWVKKAVAFWDTPQTWQEYKKKMNVNSIADWQMEDSSSIWKRCIVEIVSLLVGIFLLVVDFRFVLLAVPLVLFTGYKKKTSSIPAILLGIYNRYLMVYYYIKNSKYADVKYHIPKNFVD